MKRYSGGETVGPGLYFDLRSLSFESVDEARPLRGGPEATYRRVPVLVLMVVGPLLGLAYVVFLPFIGVAMVTWLLGVKTGHLVRGAVREGARVVRPGWEPSMAFLSRSKPAKTPREGTDEWAEEVRKTLDETERDDR